MWLEKYGMCMFQIHNFKLKNLYIPRDIREHENWVILIPVTGVYFINADQSENHVLSIWEDKK